MKLRVKAIEIHTDRSRLHTTFVLMPNQVGSFSPLLNEHGTVDNIGPDPDSPRPRFRSAHDALQHFAHVDEIFRGMA